MDYFMKTLILPRKDTRVEEFFMMQGHIPMMSTIAIYLLLNLVALPRFMKNRPAYNLKNVLRIYNVLQIITNIFMVQGFVRIYISEKWYWPFACIDVNRSMEPDGINMVWFSWFYFITRIVDLLETSFFYLRKKNNQASFLHLYHHVAAVWVTWVGIKMVPGGGYTFPMILNCMVHTIMYTYYLLAAEAGPRLKPLVMKYKKSITTIQLTQFMVILIQAARMLAPDCHAPKMVFAFHVPNVAINSVLFIRFFVDNYRRKKKVE